ncbi:nuclear transport factor 2 family protein [Streptomyces sp. NPDC048717]|uniref:nuclear transport factor 2 family protein n=1 Tax=unclassified Streptomyces TaxID=2593676 RepID=UPI00342D3044
MIDNAEHAEHAEHAGGAESTAHTEDAGRAAVQAAVDNELRLLEPAVRADAVEPGLLLDPEFVEVGSSGRRWTYEEMLAELPGFDDAQPDGPRIEASGMRGVLLAPGLVHLTYETVVEDRRARRSSLWREDASGAWRLYYHQATPVPRG